jgi:hypothetical protein
MSESWLTAGRRMVKVGLMVVMKMINADAPAKKTTNATSILNEEGLTSHPGWRPFSGNRSCVGV